MTYNFLSSAIRWQIFYFLFGGNSNVCRISHRLLDICKSRNMPQIDLENEDQGKGVENGTCAIRLEMFESI